MSVKPFRIFPKFHGRVWGVHDLSPWFPEEHPSQPIGEAWFETPDVPLLLKFLFTSAKLSVQVHPDDAYAAAHHRCAGKTEAWHVIAAEPGAQVALGLTRELTQVEARAAFKSGAIVDLLAWRPARAGDTFLVTAGTIHAIGEGLRIIEIQQYSDITYRLYDYGRPRELHLDQGLDVADLRPYVPPAAPPGALAGCPCFRMEPLAPGAIRVQAETRIAAIASGHGKIGGETFAPGHVWVIPGGCAVSIESHACEGVLCGVPSQAV